jgi:hypothetical protein
VQPCMFDHCQRFERHCRMSARGRLEPDDRAPRSSRQGARCKRHITTLNCPSTSCSPTGRFQSLTAIRPRQVACRLSAVAEGELLVEDGWFSYEPIAEGRQGRLRKSSHITMLPKAPDYAGPFRTRRRRLVDRQTQLKILLCRFILEPIRYPMREPYSQDLYKVAFPFRRSALYSIDQSLGYCFFP